MSIREYTVEVIKTMPEEKLQAFIMLFADENVLARMESELIELSPNPKLYNSFKEFLKEAEEENKIKYYC